VPKYMLKATYTAQGMRALKEQGATRRLAALRRALEPQGITIEAMYFTLAEDSFLIVEAPDLVTVLGLVLSRSGSGDVRSETVPLLTAEEMDEVFSKF
jgi:uncharacterized protein with GYD domain